tara:strand:+ start:242 stop:748 length:507 start_codon:yes stop_codon:yes gene_type:complete
VNIKIFNYFLILFLIQSCSGGRIGNFLELSFKNIEKEESKTDENNSKNEKVLINEKSLKDLNKPVLNKTNKDSSKMNNLINIQKQQNVKPLDINNVKNNNFKKNIIPDQNNIKKSIYDFQTYRVIIILKEVDPTIPAQNFSNVLKNANINFEIEKIERLEENNSKKSK